MRALRVVGITEGGDVVLEDPGRRERFTVPADEQLRAAARGDLTRLGRIAIELESQLRPREIQARIRAGASVEQVASAAGVPHQKIERFAYPVLLERSRTAEMAQRAHPVRADGPDSRMLGDVVAHTFGLRGQDYAETEWDSWKGEDGKWVVALSWRAGRSDNRALWTFQPGAHGGTVTAVDEHASDLVEGLPARPLRTVGPVIDIARPDDAAPEPSQVEELRATASDTARGARLDAGRAPAAPAERPQARTAPDPRRPVPPAQRQAETRPEAPAPRESRGDEPVDAGAATPDPAVPAPATTAADRDPAGEDAATASRTPAPDGREPGAREAAGRSEPEPAAPAADGSAEEPAVEAPAEQPAPAATKRTRKGKPVMPSWDEVLLGVRGQR